MIHRWAMWAKKYTKAESSHEQLLGWWLKLFWFPFWQVKRQVVIAPYNYRLDLAIISGKLKVAVEVDGRYWHRQGDRPLKDAFRDEYLEEQGWAVIRFTDQEVETAPASCAWHAACFARAHKRGIK